MVRVSSDRMQAHAGTRVGMKERDERGCNILFRPTYGAAFTFVFSPEEVSRAFALSSDYLLADRDARAAEESAAADALAARRERFRSIPIKNEKMSTYEFFGECMAMATSPISDKVKAILILLCKEIEAEKPENEDALLGLTHAATEQINGLEDEFIENDSELETAAREVMAADFDAIVRS